MRYAHVPSPAVGLKAGRDNVTRACEDGPWKEVAKREKKRGKGEKGGRRRTAGEKSHVLYTLFLICFGFLFSS